MISRICQEFDCTPSQAIAEPLLACLRIMEYRQYARTLQAMDAAKDEGDAPTGEMADLLMEIEADLYRERAERIAAERAERLQREAEEADTQ